MLPTKACHTRQLSSSKDWTRLLQTEWVVKFVQVRVDDQAQLDSGHAAGSLNCNGLSPEQQVLESFRQVALVHCLGLPSIQRITLVEHKHGLETAVGACYGHGFGTFEAAVRVGMDLGVTSDTLAQVLPGGTAN